MTLSQFLYIRLFTEAYWDFAYATMRRRKYIVNQTKFTDEIKLALLYFYLEMILFYYRDTVTGDENSFTVAEIKSIINTFNDIAGSHICYQEF